VHVRANVVGGVLEVALDVAGGGEVDHPMQRRVVLSDLGHGWWWVRGGERWREMERDGERWREMERDGERWRDRQRDAFTDRTRNRNDNTQEALRG